MLTRKQYELLRFINERLKEAGVPPSFDEMKDALDLRSSPVSTDSSPRSKNAAHPPPAQSRPRHRGDQTARAPPAVARLPEVSSSTLGKRSNTSVAEDDGNRRSPSRDGPDPRWRRSNAEDTKPRCQCRRICSAPANITRWNARHSMVDAGIPDGDMAPIQRNGRRHQRYRGALIVRRKRR